MEYLKLEVFDLATKENKKPSGSQFAVMEEDTSITITDTSEIFASGDVWSYSFKLNIPANAHIFGTSGDLHGSHLHEQVDHRRARLWVMGLPLYLGYLKLDDETEVDENGDINVSFESGQKTFEDMIEGAKANQVPMMGDVHIGMALWQKRWVNYGLAMAASAKFSNGDFSHPYTVSTQNSDRIGINVDGENEKTPVQEYPRMLFPKGTFRHRYVDDTTYDFDCLNTDYPYDDGHPYCNVALCYQKYGYDRKYDNGDIRADYSQEPEAQRGYEYMPANRVNSAPNFFVIYWIRALMKHLGIYIEENQMMDVEDLRRLFFVNTKCAFKEMKKIRTAESMPDTVYRFLGGQRLIAEQIDTARTIDVSKSHLDCKDFTFTGPHLSTIIDPDDRAAVRRNAPQSIEKIYIHLLSAFGQGSDVAAQYEEENSYVYKAFATSECFPDVEISEIISALENGFGIRFLFSDNFQRVRIILLKNVFRDDEVQDIHCEITGEDVKVENKIRGFRMTYGNTEDTQFYYKGFADKLPHQKQQWPDDSDKHDYSQWNLDASYGDVINKVTAFNKTCYVTPVNGNAYGVKVDKDAKRYEELHPSLFEYAGYMDAEDGDCSGDEDTIHEISVGFTPAIQNDLNMEAERTAENEEDRKQRFALFVDTEMRPRRPDLNDGKDYNASGTFYDLNEMYRKFGPNGTDGQMTSGDGIVQPGNFAIASDMYAIREGLKASIFLLVNGAWHNTSGGFGEYKRYWVWYDVSNIKVEGYVNEGYRLYLQDNFKPNDDGIPPIETKDWGLTLGIMRGSGSDAYVDYKADADDGEGNDTWEIVPGSNTSTHPDTCDSYGNEWDYNGSIIVTNKQSAIAAMQELWPDSNVDLIYSDPEQTVQRNEHTLLTNMIIVQVHDEKGDTTQLLFAADWRSGGYMSWKSRIYNYCKSLDGMSRARMKEYDSNNMSALVETDSSWERLTTLDMLQSVAFYFPTYNGRLVIDNGTGTTGGRISLKLRAEKPDPYYDATIPNIVTTEEQAGNAMKTLYRTANGSLLTRILVDKHRLSMVGWDCDGSGDIAIFGVIYDVQFSDGKTRRVLMNVITPNDVVMSQQAMASYVATLNGADSKSIYTRDTLKLVLDIGTTEQRKNILQGLQDIYYAEEGAEVKGVDISPLKYLPIDNKNLQGRGLCDQFYKEYSYWIRNARVVKRTVWMDIAQLMSIDKTKKVRVGDITGFIKKMQYTVSKKTGLGGVTMEIMYI